MLSVTKSATNALLKRYPIHKDIFKPIKKLTSSRVTVYRNYFISMQRSLMVDGSISNAMAITKIMAKLVSAKSEFDIRFIEPFATTNSYVRMCNATFVRNEHISQADMIIRVHSEIETLKRESDKTYGVVYWNYVKPLNYQSNLKVSAFLRGQSVRSNCLDFHIVGHSVIVLLKALKPRTILMNFDSNKYRSIRSASGIIIYMRIFVLYLNISLK